MLKSPIFLAEVAVKQAFILMLAVPMLFELTFDAMQEMDRSNQSSILAVVGLLMAAAIVGVFEATYQKTNIHQQSHRLLAHLTKALLFIGISELMMLAVATIGTTENVYDDPLLWALVPIYIALYLYDWWDALVSD
ncbi:MULTISPECIES: hypothetical protein [Vibrio]|nr:MULTISPECIES: hypothetical protein [Vibrio]ERB64569.1 hypothetical protein N779_14905 [Vibrio coralliilyticus OCN008]QFT39475.1 hypothetical protein FIU99_24120 [Vibrio sp. THAF64]QGM35987.1 hypothetical protein GGC04_17110 [Vibrio sp. THAF191d]QGN72963.1 hypothetical protein GGC03_24560 [Vibrio sp. THAF191c]